MKTFTVGDFKTHFSEILKSVLSGNEVAIAFGKKKEIVAYLVPKSLRPGKKRPLGLLSGQATVKFKDDFSITEAEFLGL
jgi:antitoxin (DNA-binding transcriptional repressor) of toxin-antitoxin stability system